MYYVLYALTYPLLDIHDRTHCHRTDVLYIQYIYQIAESAKYYAVMQIYICIIINKQTDMGNMTHCMTLLQKM